jgi:hypothetical protein
LCIFLNNFGACFPLKNKSIGKIKNDWITQGIKISSNIKGVYVYSRNSNYAQTKVFYHIYCKILNKVIKEAKKHYSRLVTMSDNKIKTTWSTVKRELGKIHLPEQMPSPSNGEKVKDPGKVAVAFSNFFLTSTETLNTHKVGKEDAISLLKDSFPRKFPALKLIATTETEIKSIIQSLKSKTHQVMKK